MNGLILWQGALPEILERTKEDFFSKIVAILKDSASLSYAKVKEIPCLTCPSKPEGSMFLMVMWWKTLDIVLICSEIMCWRYITQCFSFQVKLNLSTLDSIQDDVDFCVKLAKEESVIVLPGKKIKIDTQCHF